MKENFLHFISDTPCMLSINGEKVGNIDNVTHLEIDIVTKTNYAYITYEPITYKTQALPYTILLNTKDVPTTYNEHTRIVPFPNNNYDIIMSPFYYYHVIDSKVQFNGSVGKYFVSVVTDTATRVIIYSGLTIIFSTTLPVFSAVKVEETKNTIIIEGIVDEDNYYLLAVDTNNFEVIFSDFVQSIDKTSEDITLYKSVGTLCKHAIVNHINLNTKAKEEYYVFEDNTANTNINPLLIPQAFLECVKVSDEKSAKQFMSNKYSSTSIDNFKEYFGEINEIHINRHEINPHKLNYTIKSSSWRNYNFVMDNNLIEDIEEIF